MRKHTIAALVIAGIATPVVAAQAADANLVNDVIAATRQATHATASASTSTVPTATATAAPTQSATTEAAATEAATTQSDTAQSDSTATAKASATHAPGIGLGDKGDQVTEIQQRLADAGIMQHTATGYYGELTESAVRSVQSSHGLPATGRVDQATQRVIDALPAAPKPSATATASATATSEPSQSASASPTKSPTRSSKAASLDERCLTGHVMCVDKTRQRLYWVVDGQVIDDFSTRTGRDGLETREGTFHVYRMEENSWSNLYHVNMPYSMYFSGGQAVHYSKDFATNGYGVGSHGCVNLRDKSGIAWLYSQVQLGDKVVVYRS